MTSIHWNFTLDNEDWNQSNGIVWDGDNGSPSAGCMSGPTDSGGVTSVDVADNELAADSAVSFRGRIVYVSGDTTPGCSLDLYLNEFVILSSLVTEDGDSGWFQISGVVGDTMTLNEVAISANIPFGTGVYTIYIDAIYIDEVAPPLDLNYDFAQSAGGIPGSIMVTS